MTAFEAAVIIPTFNGLATIERALVSAVESIRRSGRAVAISIVDDASTDGTADFLREFAASTDESIVVGTNEINLHTPATRNQAIRQVEAAAYMFVDQDDEFLAAHVSECMDRLQRTRADYVQTGVLLDDPVHPDWHEAIANSLCQTLCVRAKAHDFIGGFLEDQVVANLGCSDVLYRRLLTRFCSGTRSVDATVRYHRRPGNAFDAQYEQKFIHRPGAVEIAVSPERRRMTARAEQLFSLRTEEVATRALERDTSSSHIEGWLERPVRDLLPVLEARSLTTRWAGVPMIKTPLDAWTYQELVFELQPEVVVELGTFAGGTALYLAHLMDILGRGSVITIDPRRERLHPRVRAHPRVTALEGYALDKIDEVSDLVGDKSPVLVIEDGSHEYEATLAVIRAFAELVTPGSYLIVEDGIGHHGLDAGPHPGPHEAISSFLDADDRFVADRRRESFVLTWNPRGYLRRVR